MEIVIVTVLTLGLNVLVWRMGYAAVKSRSQLYYEIGATDGILSLTAPDYVLSTNIVDDMPNRLMQIDSAIKSCVLPDQD